MTLSQTSSMKARTAPSKRTIKTKHTSPTEATFRKSSVGSPTIPRTSRNASLKAQQRLVKASQTLPAGLPKPAPSVPGNVKENPKRLVAEKEGEEGDLKELQSPINILWASGLTEIVVNKGSTNSTEDICSEQTAVQEKAKPYSTPQQLIAEESPPTGSPKRLPLRGFPVTSKLPILAIRNKTKSVRGTASTTQSSQSDPNILYSPPVINLSSRPETELSKTAKTSLSELCRIHETQRWVNRLEGRIDVIFDQMKVAPNDQHSEDYFSNVMRNLYLESCGAEALLLSQYALLCAKSTMKSRK